MDYERLRSSAASLDAAGAQQLEREAQRRGDVIGVALALARQSPSASAWSRLADALSSVDHEVIRSDFATLDQALSTWPDVLRTARDSWWQQRAAHEPHLRLSRRLDLSRATREQVLAVCADPTVDHITHLSLTRVPLLEADVQLLNQNAVFNELETLELGFSRIGQLLVTGLSGGLTSMLRRLDLYQTQLGDDGVIALVESPVVEQITALNLSGNLLTARAIQAMMDTVLRDRLEHLELSYNEHLGADALAQLARAHALHTLVMQRCNLVDADLEPLADTLALDTLDLGQNAFTAFGLATLVAWSGHERLKTLNLGWNPIGAAGTETLGQGRWSRLERLTVSGCKLGDLGTVHLSDVVFPALQSIALDHNEIGPMGAQALAKSAWLGPLHTLDISNNPLGSPGVMALAVPNWTPLRLSLRSTGMSDEAAVGLGARGTLARVTTLELDGNTLSARGLRHILESLATAPEKLDLSRLGLDDTQLVGLLALDKVRSVVALDLGENALGPATFEALARAELPYLESLDLAGLDVTLAAGESLARWPTLAQLKHLGLARTAAVRNGALDAFAHRLRSIESLDASEAGPELLPVVRRHPTLQHLEYLNAERCDLYEDDLAELRMLLGGGTVVE